MLLLTQGTSWKVENGGGTEAWPPSCTPIIPCADSVPPCALHPYPRGPHAIPQAYPLHPCRTVMATLCPKKWACLLPQLTSSPMRCCFRWGTTNVFVCEHQASQQLGLDRWLKAGIEFLHGDGM